MFWLGSLGLDNYGIVLIIVVYLINILLFYFFFSVVDLLVFDLDNEIGLVRVI